MAVGLCSMRLAAVGVPRAGRAVLGNVSVMSLSLVRIAALSCVWRTAVAVGSVTQPKGSASATRSSLEKAAVRNGVLRIAVAMGAVTLECAAGTMASLASAAPRVRRAWSCFSLHSCNLTFPLSFQYTFSYSCR